MTASRERCEELLMKAVDGLLTPVEESELEELLDAYPECRDELADFEEMKSTTDTLRARILADARIEPVQPDPPARLLVGVGFVLLLVTGLCLLGFAGWAFLSDAAVPLWIRITVGAAGAGLLALFLHVLRIRRRALGRDPYEEIDL